MNYYNEFDPKSAAWIRELIEAKLIPKGEVDERSITEITANDLRGFTQCHFFAGVGGWSLALKLTGWPEDRPVWTGSCPCQPFSTAGKQRAQADERHLWPVFFSLIRECRPHTVFGEQVESAIGHGWLDGISADLEGAGYACGAVVLGAHSLNSPHKRQRLYWVADSVSEREHRRDERGLGAGREQVGEQEDRTYTANEPRNGCEDVDSVGITNSTGSQQREPSSASTGHRGAVESAGCTVAMGDSEQPGLEGLAGHGDHGNKPGWIEANPVGPTAATSIASPWGDFDILHMLDGKARRTQRGLFPLVNGVSSLMVPGCNPSEQEAQATSEARVMRLKGYGNAIVPQVAAEFIKAFLYDA